MSLIPDKPTLPGESFEELILFVYGPPKIGKSSFAAQANTLFLATEQGLKSLRRYEVQIDSWIKFKRACKEIHQTKPDFKVICIDTVDNLWKFCIDYVCNKKGMEHPSDQDYGKGWDFVKDEFRRVVVKLSMEGYGLWFISHAKEESIQTRHRKLTKIQPTIPGSARSVILPMADIIAYLGVREIEKGGEISERRVAYFSPTETTEAGDKTGKLPARIRMGNSPQEFYQKFMSYFKPTGGKTDGKRRSNRAPTSSRGVGRSRG